MDLEFFLLRNPGCVVDAADGVVVLLDGTGAGAVHPMERAGPLRWFCDESLKKDVVRFDFATLTGKFPRRACGRNLSRRAEPEK